MPLTLALFRGLPQGHTCTNLESIAVEKIICEDGTIDLPQHSRELVPVLVGRGDGNAASGILVDVHACMGGERCMHARESSEPGHPAARGLVDQHAPVRVRGNGQQHIPAVGHSAIIQTITR